MGAEGSARRPGDSRQLIARGLGARLVALQAPTEAAALPPQAPLDIPDFFIANVGQSNSSISDSLIVPIFSRS